MNKIKHTDTYVHMHVDILKDLLESWEAQINVPTIDEDHRHYLLGKIYAIKSLLNMA